MFDFSDAPLFDLIAFDLDGTLADTESFSVPGAIAVLKEHFGVDISLEHWMSHYHGLAGEPLLVRIEEDFGVSVPWKDFLARRRARLPQDFARGVESAPHVLTTLRSLDTYRTAGKLVRHLAICSNSMTDRIALTLAAMRGQDAAGLNLTELFNGYTFAAVDNPPLLPKPSPDVYLAAALACHASPRRSLAVEDSPTGVMAAVAAGFTCIGYVGLARHREMEAAKLQEHGAVAIMHDWSGFMGILQGLARG